MIEDVLKDFQAKSEKTIEAFKNKLATFRTGRANAALVENLIVESYGTRMSLKSIASISIPEPKLILLQAWDRNNIPAIEKAILTSVLGLTPQTEDDMIRVIVPPLTGERREEYKKLIKQETEKSRVVVRGHRKESMDEIKLMKEEKIFSEDEEKRAKGRLQKEVNVQVERISSLLKKKLEELEQV